MLDDKAQSIVIKQSKDTEVNEKRHLLGRALKELSLYSREHRALFDTIITDIFILPSDIARAGSTSAALGVIWANPRVQYTLHDVIEILVHELSHHTMFIDELRYSHYDYESIIDRSTWATSAIFHALRRRCCITPGAGRRAE
ncbi:aKG-HExxH-type peptide beta-hydroxylase [Cupriavidus necator]|uniref:aKG-HExxH-type peptide beta-hydroxylase n=1 Tax=Cupriavidus necator TaxID=106590 RepID=UPI000F4E1A50|nr:HEXXH motif-containing putative peptide modification protein [Cupriavidus necator]